MRNKLFLVTSVFVATVMLSGCQMPWSKSTSQVNQETTNQSLKNGAQELASAMQSGQPMKCTITHKTDGIVMNYSIKNKKFRMDGLQGSTATETSHIINDGAYMYSWSTPSNKGFKMAVPSEEELKAQAEKYKDLQASMPDFSDEDTVKEYENDYTIDCNAGNVADADFIPPTDVAFQDMSVMMNDAMNQVQQGMTEEQKAQLEEMMKKYGN